MLSSTKKGTPQEQVDEYFIRMCFFCDLKYIKYLLTSSEVKPNANVHAQNDAGFAKIIDDLPKAKNAGCMDRSTEIIQYFIFDLNIEKTKSIEEILESRGHWAEPYIKMFEQRELNKALNNELINNNGKKRKNKI